MSNPNRLRINSFTDGLPGKRKAVSPYFTLPPQLSTNLCVSTENVLE